MSHAISIVFSDRILCLSGGNVKKSNIVNKILFERAPSEILINAITEIYENWAVCLIERC